MTPCHGALSKYLRTPTIMGSRNLENEIDKSEIPTPSNIPPTTSNKK